MSEMERTRGVIVIDLFGNGEEDDNIIIASNTKETNKVNQQDLNRVLPQPSLQIVPIEKEIKKKELPKCKIQNKPKKKNISH